MLTFVWSGAKLCGGFTFVAVGFSDLWMDFLAGATAGWLSGAAPEAAGFPAAWLFSGPLLAFVALSLLRSLAKMGEPVARHAAVGGHPRPRGRRRPRGGCGSRPPVSEPALSPRRRSWQRRLDGLEDYLAGIQRVGNS